MSSLSNVELRRRLEAHNYPVPPITDSTRGVLLKKLAQLDGGCGSKKTAFVPSTPKKAANGAGRGLFGTAAANSKKGLMDYSSAEEDDVLPVRRRRVSKSSLSSIQNMRGSRSSTPLSNATSASDKRSVNVSNKKTTSQLSSSPHGLPFHRTGSQTRSFNNGGNLARRNLMNFSDEENDEEGENGNEYEEDDSEGEEESEEDERVDLGIQTSLNESDVSSYRSDTVCINSNPRFHSSTPLMPVKSTANFISSSTSSGRSVQSGAGATFPLHSPLRRRVAISNHNFGSLGEVLASLPAANDSTSSSSSMTVNPTQSLSTSPVSSSSPLDVTTAKDVSAVGAKRRSGFCDSHTVSKLIVLTTGVFFLLLSYKYVHLKPIINVSRKLAVCGGTSGNDIDNLRNKSTLKACAPADKIDVISNLYGELVGFLETKVVEKLCSDIYENEFMSLDARDTVPFLDILEALGTRSDGDKDYISDRRDLVYTLLGILKENPKLGIRVDLNDSNNENDIYVALSYLPPLDWCCWLRIRSAKAWTFIKFALVYACYFLVISFFAFSIYRIHLWRREKIVRENQDVFELVEQVLSMLVAQQQHMNEGGIRVSHSTTNSGCLAVNHVRDQLIPPQDRKRKKRIWDRVVQYIRESESRVREDVQIIYGEEHFVWQWIPDIQWPSPTSHKGPNPYVVVGSSSSSPFNPVVSSTGSLISTPLSPPHSMINKVTPTNAWQGSAFCNLNQNVAAPAVAPTSCLKVRYMFDKRAQQDMPPGRSWVWRVKEEILRRCCASNLPSEILHIAVDTESNEGCVYIKAKNAEEAGKVFRTLHGQWYRGNLLTVKYLREERYHERFPDAKHQLKPLKPSSSPPYSPSW